MLSYSCCGVKGRVVILISGGDLSLGLTLIQSKEERRMQVPKNIAIRVRDGKDVGLQ